jgi:cell division protein FtsI (penicillin-binding protein 3)
MALGFSLILAKLMFLHVFDRSVLSQKAQKQHQRIVQVEGERGKILDRMGRDLAINVNVFSLFGDPSLVKNPRRAARSLAAVLKTDPRRVAGKLSGPGSFVWLGRRMEPDLVKRVEEMNLEGVGWIPESKRFYPKRELLGNVLGFSGIDNRGLEGLERQYDGRLRGKSTELVLERDARGRLVFGRMEEDLLRGNDLILTVDEVIQYIAERELDDAVSAHRAEAGMVVVMQPWTGEILAMAVRPGFNPNLSGAYHPAQWRNRVLTDVFEPGSTFKIVVASGILEEKLSRPGALIHDGSRSIRVGRSVIRDPHAVKHPLTLEEVIQHSSNVGAVKLGLLLGPEKLYHYTQAFGFGQKTGIDLPGEVRGIVSPPSKWSGRSLATIAIGQEVAVTPLQIVRAVSAIANGGWLVTPRIVKGIQTPDGEVEELRPELSRRAVSADTARRMGEMLKKVTEKEGTGHLASVPGYEVAGKTGTAQKIDPQTGRYFSDKFVSSFVGYVPADRPEMAVLVVVDSPQGAAWGGAVAAPVFSRIAEQALRYLQVPPAEKDNPWVVARNP